MSISKEALQNLVEAGGRLIYLDPDSKVPLKKIRWSKSMWPADDAWERYGRGDVALALEPWSLGTIVVDVDEGDVAEVKNHLSQVWSTPPFFENETATPGRGHLWYYADTAEIIGNPKWFIDGVGSGELKGRKGYVKLYDADGLEANYHGEFTDSYRVNRDDIAQIAPSYKTAQDAQKRAPVGSSDSYIYNETAGERPPEEGDWRNLKCLAGVSLPVEAGNRNGVFLSIAGAMQHLGWEDPVIINCLQDFFENGVEDAETYARKNQNHFSRINWALRLPKGEPLFFYEATKDIPPEDLILPPHIMGQMGHHHLRMNGKPKEEKPLETITPQEKTPQHETRQTTAEEKRREQWRKDLLTDLAITSPTKERSFVDFISIVEQMQTQLRLNLRSQKIEFLCANRLQKL